MAPPSKPTRAAARTRSQDQPSRHERARPGRAPAAAAGSVTTEQRVLGQEDPLPPIRPALESAVDAREVERLDSWFEGVSRPSRRIQELVERKGRKHEALLRHLRQELFRERSAAERTVCFISTNLRTELDKASLMIKLKGTEVAELASFSSAGPEGDCRALREAVGAASDVVQQLTEQRRRAVDAFYDLLLDVEAEHQRHAKEALRKYSRALARNGHLPPLRLQPVLDAEMKEVSELHLRHVISFGDLRLCLNMHAEKDCRKFKEGVERARRLNREQCQRAVFSALQEAGNKSTDEYISLTSKGRESLKSFDSEMAQLKKALVLTETYPFSADDICCWEKGVCSGLQQLDAVAEQLSRSLTDGLIHLRAHSTNEIERLKTYLDGSELCTAEKFDQVFRNVGQPLLHCIDKKIADEPTSLMKSWKEMLAKILPHTDALRSLLKDAGKLWDLQIQLQASRREIVLKNLHDKIQDRGKHVEAKENRILLVIEKSRQETNKKCLKDGIMRIYRILDEVKSSYETMHRQENEILEGYTKSISNEINFLHSSIETFLTKHGKSSDQDEELTKIEHSMNIIVRSKELLVYIEQEKQRWFKTIEYFLTEQSENIVQKDGEEWLHQQEKILQDEYKEIFESHSFRYKQIQSEVEFTRLAELSEHENLLSIHKEVVAGVSIKIQNGVEEIFVKLFQIFRDLGCHIKVLQENGSHSTSVQSVQETIDQVRNSYAQCKESVKSIVEQYNKTIQEQMQGMREDNNYFVRSLKQFSGGGTFAESEVTNIKTEIRTLELDAESEERRTVLLRKQKSKECCTEALKHVKTCLRDLQLHLENLNFTKDITAPIEKTQIQLKKHVLALKCGGKLLREQINELVDSCIERPSMSDMRSKWRFVLDSVIQRQQCLLSAKVMGEDTDGMVALSSSEPTKSKQDKAFLSIIFGILTESLQQVQRVVKEFHGSTSVLGERDDAFMTEIKLKYKLYKEQCVEVWINEVTGLLESVQKLRSSHTVCWNKIVQGMYQNLSDSLKEERVKLNNELIVLRVNYQQYQVDTMAKVSPPQRFHGNYRLFGSLCAEFERASVILSRNIKNAVNRYMEKTKQYLKNYEDNMREQYVVIIETTNHLLGEQQSEDIMKATESVLVFLNENHSLDLPLRGFFQHSSNKFFSGSDDGSKCSPNIISAIEHLYATANKFLTISEEIGKSMQRTADSGVDALEDNVKEGRVLVEDKTCEVKHLYDQYKNMAEELRMNWRRTLENIDQFNTL